MLDFAAISGGTATKPLPIVACCRAQITDKSLTQAGVRFRRVARGYHREPEFSADGRRSRGTAERIAAVDLPAGVILRMDYLSHSRQEHSAFGASASHDCKTSLFWIRRMPRNCNTAKSSTSSATTPTTHFPAVLKGTMKIRT